MRRILSLIHCVTVALGILRRLLRHQPGLLLDQHGSRYDAIIRRYLDELGLGQLHQNCRRPYGPAVVVEKEAAHSIPKAERNGQEAGNRNSGWYLIVRDEQKFISRHHATDHHLPSISCSSRSSRKDSFLTSESLIRHLFFLFWTAGTTQ